MKTDQITPTEDSILTGANEIQKKAITTPGSLLLLAGAGSGKTKVLSSRVVWTLKKGHQKSSIMAVSFTNKSAKEMTARISKMLESEFPEFSPNNDSFSKKKQFSNTDGLTIGTFHSICHQMLRESAKKIGIDPSFHLVDDDDQKSIIKRIIAALNIKPTDMDDAGLDIKAVINFIGQTKAAGGAQSIPSSTSRMLISFYEAYDEVLSREGAMDFADLILKTNEALSQNIGSIRDHYRAKFKFLLVDEFQDTNPEQYKFLQLVKSNECELFAVGDDDQSIYAFRGADANNMHEFVNNMADGKIIRMEQNYRSTGHILDAANSVIDHNEGRIGKSLFTDAGKGHLVTVKGLETSDLEATIVANQIKALVDQKVEPNEIAVLYRSSAQAAAIEQALIKRAVPYVVYSGTRFFDRKEIKDVLSYLRLSANEKDDTAFVRSHNMPPRRLGPSYLERIRERSNQKDIPLMTATIELARESGLTQSGHDQKLWNFVNIIEECQISLTNIDGTDKPLGAYIKEVLEYSGLLDHYRNDIDKATNKKDKEDAENRVANLEQLVDLSQSFSDDCLQKKQTSAMLLDFMAMFTLEDGSKNSTNNKRAVVLSTIHSAKGLEFDHVYMVGVEENLLPHARSVNEDKTENNNLMVEEERRLMYVGMTRARKNLMVTFAEKRRQFGEVAETKPSVFITEIDSDACLIDNKTKLMLEAIDEKPSFRKQSFKPRKY